MNKKKEIDTNEIQSSFISRLNRRSQVALFVFTDKILNVRHRIIPTDLKFLYSRDSRQQNNRYQITVCFTKVPITEENIPIQIFGKIL